MISNEDITTMRRLLLEAFPSYDNTEREKMLNDLVNRYSNPKTFCVMNGTHIARIGVRYHFSNNVRGCYYYSTEFDNEFMDL